MRFSNLLASGLAAAALTGMACNPADFSGLADDAWADAQDPSTDSGNSNVFIGYAPRTSVVSAGETAAHAIIFGASRVSLTRFDYRQDGTFSKGSATDAVRLNIPTFVEGSELRFARSRDDGYVVALLQRSGGDYSIVGDTGDTTDDNGDPCSSLADKCDTLAEPQTFHSGLPDLSNNSEDVNLLGVAIGGVIIAGVGPRRSDESGPRYLEALPIGGGEGSNIQCRFDPAMEIPAASYAVNDSVAILVGTESDVAANRYMVSTDIGLRLAAIPTIDPLDVCLTAEVDTAGVIVDGLLEYGSYVGGPGLDVFGVQLGESIVAVTDYDPSVGGFGAFGGRFVVTAPSGASAEWGTSIAVGDFDDDGVSELAVGDPGENSVGIFELNVAADGASASPELVKTISPLESRDGYGKSLAALPFYGGKDVLMVGTDSDVITYFRLFTDDENSDDRDPR